MKTRIVVHIALNAKGERVLGAVESCGRILPFEVNTINRIIETQKKGNLSAYWMSNRLASFESVKYWKKRAKQTYRAARFQRVTLLGEAK